MKIEDVVETTLEELNQMPRFDLAAMPKQASWPLQALAWILSFPETFATRSKITKVNMTGIRPPYVLLCNHNSFLDFKVATRAVFPHRSSYVVAVDGFINREGIMRNVGCIAKRKFVNDSRIIRAIRHTLEVHGDIAQIYPEARYSLVGTTSPLPDSLGKLVKMLEHPVVVLLSHGHHLRQPFWNLHKRKVRTTSTLTCILTKEDLRRLDAKEIQQRIVDAFQYNEYRYQLEAGIRITYKDRAKGLHKPLYQCVNCGDEHHMQSDGNRIWCDACGDTHEMDEFGQLHNTSGTTRFSHIPDWFEWIRHNVRQEVIEARYHMDIEVKVDSLPNNTGYYRLGTGRLVHDADGFHLSGEWDHGTLSVHRSVPSMFGCHIEYDYFGKGDCVSISTMEDTYYLYPTDPAVPVTKFHFATEELYAHHRNHSRNKED
jgi:1-acyl-sn-glycerol-3-phosphate acyltransferase